MRTKQAGLTAGRAKQALNGCLVTSQKIRAAMGKSASIPPFSKGEATWVTRTY